VKIALSDKPWAWQVFVRRLESGKMFVLYSTYETEKSALRTLRAIQGPPLECKLVPLYPQITNEDLK